MMTLPITPTRKHSRAFTLVEMLLVVTIIGILVTVSVPRFTRSFERMKLRSGARDVAATVEYAQATSILEERFLQVHVSSDGAECWIAEERVPADLEPMPEVRRELPDGVFVERIDFADRLIGGRRYIEFRPNGDTDPCTIRVRGRTNGAFEVVVTRGAGNARVVEAAEAI